MGLICRFCYNTLPRYCSCVDDWREKSNRFSEAVGNLLVLFDRVSKGFKPHLILKLYRHSEEVDGAFSVVDEVIKGDDYRYTFVKGQYVESDFDMIDMIICDHQSMPLFRTIRKIERRRPGKYEFQVTIDIGDLR